MKPFLFFAFTLFLTPAFSQNKNAAAEKIIRQNAAAFSQSIMDADWDAIVDAYTDDAKIFPGGQDILEGTEAVRNYWTPPADRKNKVTYHHLTPVEIKILGNEAYDYGYYEGKTLMADGTENSWKGKYVVVWKEVKPGVWKMYLDIWNRIN